MVESASQIISTTVAPIVLISAVGLLLLMEQNRYARIKDKAFAYINRRNELRTQIKILTQNRETMNEERMKRLNELNRQLGYCETILSREMREVLLIKNAMFSGLIAISLVALTSILLLGESTEPATWMINATLAVYALGLLSLLVSVIFMAADLWVSFGTIGEEIISEGVEIFHSRGKIRGFKDHYGDTDIEELP